VARQPPKSKPGSLADLRVARRIPPGRDGAKRFSLRYGEQLVCVRHRLDPSGTTRYTTVELLVEQTPVVPAGTRLVALRPDPGDKYTRSVLLACGALWDKTSKVWLAPRKIAKSLGLLHLAVKFIG
jgi:hypothetical protein